MDLTFLPVEILSSINKINIDKLYEIRLRENYPCVVNYSFKRYFLSYKGLSLDYNEGVVCKKGFIDSIIKVITEYSVYAYNDKIKQGYITLKNGIRVGLSGECVFDLDKIITIKNIDSILIRVPHEVKECSKNVFECIVKDNDLLSTLICSPPFCGKTTILKDLAKKINDATNYSILIIDERGEFETISGVNIDKLRYSDKLYAFNCGVRSLAPELIITDELASINDFNCVKNAINSGVKIIASCHVGDINGLKDRLKGFFGLFNRYVFLKNKDEMGVIDKIYDKDFNVL